MKKLLIILLVLSALSLPRVVSAQSFTIGTNVLEVFFLAPDVEVGFATGTQTSLHLDACYVSKPWDIDRFFAAGAEYRFWLSGNTMTRLFIGGRLQYANYDYRRESLDHYGDAVVFGPTVGYDFLLKDKCILEVSAGLGGAWYRENCGSGDVFAPQTGVKFVPNRLALTFYWIIA